MAKTISSSENADEEDYIDMEVSSSSTSIFYSITSPPFEFQMSSSTSLVKEQPTTSPADELFYKGNLLPLHLPPRLQMVQTLLQHSNTTPFKTEYSVSNYTTPFTTSTNTTTTCTPFESCNISPAESRRVSKELSPDEYLSEFSTELRRFIEEEREENPKKSWSKKLNLIRSSSLSNKLKASKAYFKSLFNKSGCSDESCTEATSIGTQGSVLKAKECINKYIKVAKKTPFGHIQRVRHANKDQVIADVGDSHRRSFSGAINRCLATKCPCSSSSCGSGSSSSSSSSANSNEVHLLKRSSSANSEIETSIQGAIAHCKQSQQIFQSRKSASDVGFCSFSVGEDQERPGICRG